MRIIIITLLFMSNVFAFDISVLRVLDALGIKYSIHKSKVIDISDGDTIKVNVFGKNEALRLIGADTPEVGGNKLPKDADKCNVSTEYMKSIGKISSDYTKSTIKIGDDVVFIVFGMDKYNRPVSYLLNHHSIKLIANGYAIAYDSPQLPTIINSAFAMIEQYAKFTRQGLWRNNSKIMECIKK